jgi:galactokinase/mevalonate kinase-like predicted kinase
MRHTKDRVKAKAQEITETVEVSNLAGIDSLMKRGWLALEDSKWSAAEDFFDRVLDINAEYAPAYVGKLCFELSDTSVWMLGIVRSRNKNDYFAYVINKEADLGRFYKPLDDMPT